MTEIAQIRDLWVIHHDHDSPENRAAAEQLLREKGVTRVRHIRQYQIATDDFALRSDNGTEDLTRFSPLPICIFVDL